jgi:hypothetical protein
MSIFEDYKYIGTNELGYKWFLDQWMTKYLRNKGGKGYVCVIKDNDQFIGRMLLDKDQKPVCELPSNVEQAACKIDMLTFKIDEERETV